MKGLIKKNIQKIKGNKDGRTLLQNIGFLSLMQVAGYVFPLITMPYLARVIGPDGFGKIALASAVVIWIQTIADWGFNFTATRDVAKNRDNKELVSKIFSDVLWSRCLLTLISGIILFVIVLFVPYFKENAGIIFATFLMVPGHVFFPEWFFQGMERMKYTTIFNLLFKFLFTIAVFIVIKEPSDYIWSPLLTSFGYIICGIVAFYIIVHKWGYSLYRPSISNINNTIKGSADVFINSIMPNLYNSFSVMLLGFFGGSTANGIYDAGNKFPTIIHNLLLVLSRSFFPFLSRRGDKHTLFAVTNIGLTILCAIILIIFAPLIVKIFFGYKFMGSVIILRIMAVSIIFQSVSNTYGTNYLIIRHKERLLRNITFVVSILGMMIAIPLVKYFGAIGAALTVLISRALLGVFSYFGYLKDRRTE